MRAIFISYRRDDAEGHAGRLFEDLSDRFGKASVFMDVTGIEPGRDFRKVIEQQVASCGVLLAVIGKSWLSATDAQGRARLDDPYDFVRLETATALTRDIPVIPVLVHGAHMPRPELLPEGLKDLAFRNSVELTHARWSSDVQLLINALLPYVDESPRVAPMDPGAAVKTPAQAAAGPAIVQPEIPDVRKAPRLAIAAAAAAGVAIAAAFIGYAVWHRADTASPPSSVAPTVAPTAVDRATPASAPEMTVAHSATRPEAAASRPATTASVEAVPPKTEAAPVSPAVAAAPPQRKAAASVPDPLSLERGARARAELEANRRLAAKARAASAPPAAATTATAATARVDDAPPAARATPEIARDTIPRPEPAHVVHPPAAAPPESLTFAKVEPSRSSASVTMLGDLAAPSSATRTIAIRVDTRYVNVTGGEVVRFTIGDKAFAWNFNGRSSSFDLAAVAPPGMLDRKVTAYVAPNPLYPRRER